MDSAKGVPVEVWIIGALAIVGIAIFATQSSAGFSYLPGETDTAQAIIAQNGANADRNAAMQETGAQLAVGYQESLDTERTTLSLANLASASEYQLAQLAATSNYSLATLSATTSRAELAQELNTATAQAKIQQSTAKNNAFWGFLGSLASGVSSLFGIPSAGGAGAAAAPATAPPIPQPTVLA